MLTTDKQIEDFILEYKSNHIVAETTVRAILKRAQEYEDVCRKYFYDFTEDEILSMFKDARVISHMSLQNWNNILKHAARWITGKAGNNAYELITKDKVMQCLDFQKRERMILTRNDLIILQDTLLNWTDMAILELLFLGTGGKWLRELCYLDKSQVSSKDMKIYFQSGKTIPIDKRCYEILQASFNEEWMMSYSQEANMSAVRSVGIYKMRTNTLYSSDNANSETDAERRYRWVQRRLTIIRDYVDVPITSNTVQNSGLLHYLREGINRTGMSFREYAYSEEGKQLAMRYDILSQYAPITLIEKFKEYFE